MASIQFNFPDNVCWGDYLVDGREVTVTLAVKKPDSEPKPEVIRIQKEDDPPVEEPVFKRMPWCKRGNACPWSNCKFRHERCKHFNLWMLNDCKGRGCRSLKYDPLSNKCPADGGCMYDHRDPLDLKEFIETLEINTEEDLLDQFKSRGLTHMYDETYDMSKMKIEDKQLLFRSLKAARENEILQYGDENDDVIIHFIEE